MFDLFQQALDLWMAGCMMFVFAALGEFVVVKVLDKQYQLNKSKAQESAPRIIPIVSKTKKICKKKTSKMRVGLAHRGQVGIM